MNRTATDLREILIYIGQQKIFLFIWVLIISSIFIGFSFKIEQQFKASVNYKFPKAEITTDSMRELLDFLQRKQTFHLNFKWLNKKIKEDSLYSRLILKKNENSVNISLSSVNPENLEKDLLGFVSAIEEMFIEEKSSNLLLRKNEIYSKIEKIKIHEPQSEREIITKNLNKTLEDIITEEYSINNLHEKQSLKVEFKENKLVSKKLLISGSIIFALWSGLMIIIIKFFIKK